MRLSSSYQETKHILIVIMLLTVVFSFNDKSVVFNPDRYVTNFIYVLVLVTFSMFVHLVTLKFASAHFGVSPEFRLWSLEEISNIRPIKWKSEGFRFTYSGILVALLITLISNGKAFFTAVSTFSIDKTKALGKIFSNITEYEISIIASLVIFAHVLLVILFKSINVDLGVTINTWMVLWNLIPLSSFLGSKIFFGSRTLYVFTFVTSVISLILIRILSALQTVILTIIVVLLAVYFYFRYVEAGYLSK